MITTFYPPHSFGGDATYVRGLARGLVARGHEVTVISCLDAYNFLNRGPAAPDEDSDDGVTVHRLTTGFGTLSPLITQQTGRPGLKGPALDRILASPFDVINFHNISLIGGPAILARGTAKVRVYTLHEHWLVCPTHIFWKNGEKACDRPTCLTCCVRSGIPPQLWRYTGLRDRSLEHIDLMLSPSEYTARRHREGGIRQPIDVLPLFSSLATPGDEAPNPPPRAQFVFAGRVTASKGIEPLLRVAAKLPDIDFTVIGEGDLLNRLRSEYAGNPNIRFTGQVPQHDLIAYYREAAGLIFPSIAPETFGLTIVEAAACGTPAIVRRGSGGGEEIVARTGGGIIYDDDGQLVDAIRLLAANPVHRAELGARALAGYRTCYTRDIHIDGYLQAIDGAIASSRRQGSEY